MKLAYRLDQINDAAEQLLDHCKHYNVICFKGNLGAGKTTFIRALCQKLAVEENVSSPTYSIINEYKSRTGKSIFHLDLYRLKDEEEAILAGVEEIINGDAFCLVEWPEKAAGLFNNGAVNVTFRMISNEERELEIVLP